MKKSKNFRETIMEPQISSPVSVRAKAVYFIWRNIPRLIFLCLIVFIVVLFGTIKAEKQSIETQKAAALSQERPPINTVVQLLKPTRIRDSINLPGSIEPWTTLDLKARIDGTVAEILVAEGDEVKTGQVLARLEIADYRIALARAEAAYKLALANYERDKIIFAKGIIPVAEMDIKETGMQTAKADLDNARLLYSRCNIKSPMAGVIRRMDAKVGLLLSLGDPVAQILRIDRVKAVVGIPESDITAIRKLTTVDLKVQSLEGRIMTGKKHFISPSPETAARLYRLELALENPDRELLPGMFVRAELVKKEVGETIAIPFYSVISRNNKQFVFVEENGLAVKRTVRLGIMEKWRVQVTQGLSAGDKIIVEGHRDVESGQEIKVVQVVSGDRGISL